ncbi:MAG: putative lipid II flippase FtsW [Faecalibacterium sp.]|nr:putative lipid II flippase FtsW [Ruminococcus sp.]MCM1392861.1 putative lipid II flippase FtsW [Ruminococcus sp.]MCM1485418.1 putative lipid II flippase FtsW [Faecalibacterium sp.]
MSDGTVKRQPVQGRRPVKKEQKSLFRLFFHSGSIDVIFCCFVMLLFAFGIIMMYSASYAYAARNEGSANIYFLKQLGFGAAGFVMMFFISKIDYRVLNSAVTPYFAVPVTLILLLAALFTNGDDSIRRWIKIGPIQFQPSEIAKFVLVLFMAYLLCILYEPLRSEKGKPVQPNCTRLTNPEKKLLGLIDTPFKCAFLLAMVVGVFFIFVIAGKHLSGSILILTIGAAMMWVGGVKKKYFAFVAVGLVIVTIIVVKKPELLKHFANYAYERVAVWEAKDTVGKTTYWQTKNGLFAIGSGGPFGLGFGNSKQKLLYVPEPQNDFIFAIVCEELGFVGAMVVIILFALLIVRGFMIATKTTDYFGSLLVIGIMMQIGLQVILNIAVVTDTIPNTGVPLPFFSYGGTSLFILLCEMGVVLSVSRRSYLDKE